MRLLVAGFALVLTAAEAAESPANPEKRFGSKRKTSLQASRPLGGQPGAGKAGFQPKSRFLQQPAPTSLQAAQAGAVESGAFPLIGAGAAQGGLPLGGGGPNPFKGFSATLAASGATHRGAPAILPLQPGQLTVTPAHASLVMDSADPVVFKVLGISKKEATKVCYAVLAHPAVPTAVSPDGRCSKAEDYVPFTGNEHWSWDGGAWTGRFTYDARGWGVAGIKVRSFFMDASNGKSGSGSITVVPPQGPPAADFPPFGRYRTDFNAAAKGTEADPLDIPRECRIAPPADWQEELCKALSDAPKAYGRSNSLNVGRDWSDYWVLHINDEPAFIPGRQGPPGQSLPADSGSVVVEALSDGFRLGARGDGGAQGNLYVGAGYQKGRGARGNIVPNARHLLSFEVELEQLKAGSPGHKSSIHFFVETQHQGKRRFSWIFLGELGTGYTGKLPWNWPITDSMWFPGAEIGMAKAADYAAKCGNAVEPIVMGPGGVGKPYLYDIDLEELVGCLSGVPGTAPITGIHFAVEQNSMPGNVTTAVFRKPVLRRKPRLPRTPGEGGPATEPR